MNAAENNAELSTILGKTKFTNLNPLAVQKLFNAVKVEVCFKIYCGISFF